MMSVIEPDYNQSASSFSRNAASSGTAPSLKRKFRRAYREGGPLEWNKNLVKETEEPWRP
jgi:hypothetical protein